MWGCIATEASYQLNFNTGFSTTKSDVLIHLAQWQYWWWFWFSFLWSFYYFLISKIIRYRSLKMRPKIVTSFKPHGKWGDFLAAIIPVIWCLNILTNSNFILRLIEWQNESSLFVIRIRARQWYWIYKFELKNFLDILISPKNIGRNKWQLNIFGDLLVTNDYLHVLQLRAQNKWIKNYWDSVINKTDNIKQNHILNSVELLRSNFNLIKNEILIESSLNKNFNYNTSNFVNVFNYKNYLYFKFNKNFNKNILISNFSLLNRNFLESEFFFSKVNNINFFLLNSNIVFKQLYFNILNVAFFKNFSDKISYYSDFIESSRYIKKQQGVLLPIRLIKLNINLINNKFDNNLFRIRFNNGISNIQSKNLPNDAYLSIIQKRYERKKLILPIEKQINIVNNNINKKIKYFGKSILLNNKIFEEYINDATSYYRMLKKNKKKNELISVNLNRRILRTKRTLVLPAHTNITLITNSFDIVHSWFIPGLGIKLDCVPGRSTHHTFYIDNVGFYYGQCAEICGRYHHHMPIRVCALPFEHFLVWWYNFGLPKLIYTNNQKKYTTYYSFRKYIW